MINILIPMTGLSTFENSEYLYPKPLIEIDGNPIITYVVDFLAKASRNIIFTFLITDTDYRKYHLDYVLKLIRPDCKIIVIKQQTSGAACTCLLAIDHLNQDIPLIISSADHIITKGYPEAIDQFIQQESDAGVICFDSIHPKWSFVRLDEQQNVIETAEKRPLSRHAIAGIYYFKKTSFFFDAAKLMIEKDASIDGLFYISPTLNELVLKNMRISIFNITTDNYFNFYSPQKIKEFENFHAKKKNQELKND